MKKQLTTFVLLGMTVFLLAASVYISTLLKPDATGSGVTTIKKTKASAQSYHKLLALNVPAPSESPSVTMSPSVSPVVTSAVPSPTLIPPTPTTKLLALNPTVIPTSAPPSPTPTTMPTVFLSPTLAVKPTGNVFITGQPSPTPELIAYRNPSPSISPSVTISPVPAKKTPTPTSTKIASPAVTKIPTKNPQLPESGWIQISSILFIVATTTIFISFLF